MNEPIGDTARSILDGHIVLSRRLASSGHFPTVEVLDSLSRVAPAITTREQRADGIALRQLLAAHRDARDLIEIGAYVTGTNPLVDRAVALEADVRGFLTQDMDEQPTAAASWAALAELVGRAS
jgi:flagellum-specific ATP synthase